MKNLLLATAAGLAWGCTGPDSSSGNAPATVDAASVAGPPQRDGANEVAKIGHWPVWRGPHGDGISRETGWTADWPAAGPKIAWRKELGTGYSAVSISGGRLYSMGHVDGREHVYCLDARTGEEIWKHGYPGKLVDNLHAGGPCATPTIDGGRVYTMGREGQLFCLNAENGRVLWSKRLQEEFGVRLPEWGFTCSPLVHGDMLLVEAGRTAALDKTSGQVLWQTERFRPGYGSPVVFSPAGEPLVAVLNNDCLLIVQAADGSEVARHDWQTDYATSSTTPIVQGDTVFISTGYNRGCALLRLSGSGLKVLYTNREMSNHMNNSVLWNGHLYGFSGNSHVPRQVKVVCMEYATGQVKWSQRGLGCGALMLSDGKLIALGDQGELALLHAATDGYQEIARAKVLDGTCWTVPVLAGGMIYCRNESGRLVCVDVGK